MAKDEDGYYQLKSSEKVGNPFEKLKLARDPMKHLLHLNEVETLARDVATRGFEAVDIDKEAEAELDHRLKWLGFFHKRKHAYGTYMMRAFGHPGAACAPAAHPLAASRPQDPGRHRNG